ncbi:MAG: histidine kinase, partial [Fimbriimonadaceae bacterium]|nr:histidine kinase [Chitinophagales bacterium]
KGENYLAGDNAGNVIMIQENKSTLYHLPSTKEFNRVKQIATHNNTAYIATDDDTYILDETNSLNRISNINSAGEIVDNMAYKSITISSNNTLAAAAHIGLYRADLKKEPIVLKNDTDLDLVRYYQCYYDLDNRLWFQNAKGIGYKQNEKIIYLDPTVQEELFDQRINSFAQLDNNSILAATHAKGVYLLNTHNGTIAQHFTKENFLSSNLCKKIYVKNDTVYIASYTGIDVLHYSKNTFTKIYSLNGSIHSCFQDINDFIITEKALVLATNSGIYFWTNYDQLTQVSLPRISITNIFQNENEIFPSNNNFTSVYGNNISVICKAISFNNNKITYAYRLQKDAAWNFSSSGNLNFAKPEPGEYNFEVKALSENNLWGESETITMIIKAPFWKQPWFNIIVILLVCGFLSACAIYYINFQRKKQLKNLELQNKIVFLEQQSMQAMMNPHFIFNSLNSVQQYLSNNDVENTNRFLTRFARLIRLNLETARDSFLTIEEEMQRLELYLSVEKMRFEEKLNYTIQHDEKLETDEWMLPTMILQPFVENAIWHGIMPLDHPGNVAVYFAKKNEQLIITISDDGVGLKHSKNKNNSKEKSSLGIQLIRQRLQLLSRKTGKIFTLNTEDISNEELHLTGTRITITLPLIKETT